MADKIVISKAEEILRKEWEYIRQEDGTLCLTHYHGNDIDLIIPGQIGTDRVTTLGYVDRSSILPIKHSVFDRIFKCDLRSVIISEGISCIEECVFSWCTHLKSVQLPESILKIGPNAFANCYALETVTFPMGFTEIENRASDSCTGLKRVEGIPEDCLLEGSEFNECPKLADADGFVKFNGVLYGYTGEASSVTISEDIRIVSNCAFKNHKTLQSVTLPKGVTRIDAGTFSNCHGLKTVIATGVTKAWEDIFAHCCVMPRLDFSMIRSTGFKLALIRGFLEHPEYYDSEQTGEYTRLICARWKTFLPNFLMADNVAAVALLAEGRKITARNYEKMYFEPAVAAGAKQCVAFLLDWKNRNFPEKLKQPERTLEANVPVEETPKDPNSPEEMKKLWTFSESPDGCLSINGYKGMDTHVVVPKIIGGKRVTQIDKQCFSRSKYSVSGDQKKFLKSGLKSVVIPDGVVRIGKEVFYDCAGLTSVTIPSSVTTIGEKAFARCTGLASIEIPNSVNTIGRNSFEGCTGLASIEIPNSVTTIEQNAFKECTGLNSIAFPESVTDFEDGILSDCTGLTEIVFPKGIKKIPAKTFSGCKILKHITIPDSVTELGENAFWFCRSLESITIPPSVTTISNGAFSGCSNLRHMTIPDTVTNFDSRFAVSSCSGLISVVLPKHLRAIGYYAFDGCSELTAITIPEGVTEIGESAFDSCEKLASISIPDGVTKIGASAFAGCTELERIIIPEGVTELSERVFAQCSKLARVSLPKGLSRVESGAFAYCTALRDICLTEAVRYMGSNVFDGCAQITIHAPAGSYAEIYAKDYNLPFVAE